jgi:predicted PhzF superfamily epimerase YddE/YHI9
MRFRYFVVDAFAERSFQGNPAGVVPLLEWPDDALLQSIATQNNLSETAFFVPKSTGQYELRWFTPGKEIDLCGHATLATAFVLYSEFNFTDKVIRFHSRSGPLAVTREGDGIILNFPARPPVPCGVPTLLSRALDAQPLTVLKARDYLAVFASEAEVRALRPDFGMLRDLDAHVIVTAAGADCDFVSRFFAPSAGVPEDPVTGSAHCTLIPYWSQRLKKTRMFARQLSKRGGELFCEAAGERVLIGGKALLYLKGHIELELPPRKSNP